MKFRARPERKQERHRTVRRFAFRPTKLDDKDDEGRRIIVWGEYYWSVEYFPIDHTVNKWLVLHRRLKNPDETSEE